MFSPSGVFDDESDPHSPDRPFRPLSEADVRRRTESVRREARQVRAAVLEHADAAAGVAQVEQLLRRMGECALVPEALALVRRLPLVEWRLSERVVDVLLPDVFYAAILDGIHRASRWPQPVVHSAHAAAQRVQDAAVTLAAGLAALSTSFESHTPRSRRESLLRGRHLKAVCGFQSAEDTLQALDSAGGGLGLRADDLASMAAAMTAHTNSMEAALGIVRYAQRMGTRDIRLFNYALRALRHLRDPEEALELLPKLYDEMRQCERPPDLVSYIEGFSSLQALCRSGKLTSKDIHDMVAAMLEPFPIHEWLGRIDQPDVQGRFLSQLRDLSPAERRAKGVRGQIRAAIDAKLTLLVNCMVGCFARVGGHEDAWDAARLLERWGLKPDERTFAALVGPIRDAKPQNAVPLLHRIAEWATDSARVRPSAGTLRLLVRALLEAEDFENALVLLQHWKAEASNPSADGVPPPGSEDYQTFILLAIQRARGDLAEALAADFMRFVPHASFSNEFTQRAKRSAASLRADDRRNARAFLRRWIQD